MASLTVRPDLFYIEKFQNESLHDLRLQIKQDPKLLKLILSNLGFHKSVLVQSPIILTFKSFRLIPRSKYNSKEVKAFFKTITSTGILRFRKSGELYELFSAALELKSSRTALKFIELGMNLNIRNKYGKSLLHSAAFYGKVDVVQKLIDKGMDVNALDDNKMTPLHLACKKGNTEVVKKLLQKRAKLNLQNRERKTPLMLACKYGHSTAALALLERTRQRQPLIKIKSDTEMTALHYAAENNLTEVAKILIEKKANVLVQNSACETPKVLALLKGSKKCADILPDDPYSLEFICRKLISHFNSLKGNSEIDGTSIPLEGAFPQLMHEKIKEYFENYANDVDTGLSCLDEFHLFKAFEKSSLPISITETVDSIKKRKLTILPTGWKEHAFDLFFYDQTYFGICNGGEGVPQKKKTIVAYKFDATKINANLISKILSYDNKVKEVGKIFFYNLLPKQIAFSDDPTKNKDEICDLLEKSSNKTSKSGICSAASGKIALRAASILLKIAKKKEEDKEQLQLEAENMKKMTQDAATYFGIKSQSDYLEHGIKPDSKFFDVHFISEPLLNSEQKIKKRSSSEFVQETFDDLLEKYIDLSSTESPNKKIAINREFHA